MDEDYEPSEEYEGENKFEELRERVDALESNGESRGSGEVDGTIPYLSGVALAMILSWSRNASILWCMAHGLVSWVYVIYVAFTR